jgi:transcriptional/translational regulatory protein YebC/TACO1
MPAFSRGIRSFVLQGSRGESICSRCLFSTTTSVQSGHNRWSKIKHDKGKADASKTAQRSILSQDIALASKRKKSDESLKTRVLTSIAVYGGDPNTNPRLAAILANAKKGI